MTVAGQPAHAPFEAHAGTAAIDVEDFDGGPVHLQGRSHTRTDHFFDTGTKIIHQLAP